MKQSLTEFIAAGETLLQDVPDGSITGDAFAELFVNNLADSFMPQLYPSNVFSCLLLNWPQGKADAFDSQSTPVFMITNSAATITHNTGSQTLKCVMYDAANNLVSEENYYINPTDDNNAQVVFYKEPPTRQFYKLVIIAV